MALESNILTQNSLSFVLVFTLSKEHCSWLTVKKELFACQVTVVCAGRLNTKVNVEPGKHSTKNGITVVINVCV